MQLNVYSGSTCPSIYRGIVEDNADPNNLGRCKVRVPSVHGELTYPVSILPWARPLVLSPVSKGKGSVNIPAIGDIVWVLFEESNKEFPVYLGGTYATEDIEVNKDRVDFYIEKGSKVSYDRVNNSFSVTVGNNNLTISSSGISIVGNTNISNLTVSGNLKVSGTTTLNNLVVNGTAKMQTVSASSCNKECRC